MRLPLYRLFMHGMVCCAVLCCGALSLWSSPYTCKGSDTLVCKVAETFRSSRPNTCCTPLLYKYVDLLDCTCVAWLDFIG